MGKLINYGLDSRLELKKGIDAVANAVKVTLGPNGKNVVFNRRGEGVVITKDGVTVAKEVILDDDLQNTGAQLVKDVASKTNNEAGDGTTTATILSQSVFENGLKYTRAGVNSIELKRGMDLAVNEVVKYLEGISLSIEEGSEQVRRVATISANNDEEIGNLIYDAVTKAGKDGIVTFDEAKSGETRLRNVNGMQLDKGYMSPYFITNENKMTVNYDNPYYLLVDGKVSNINDLLPIFNEIGKAGAPLIIIADDIDTEIINMMIFNKLKTGFKIAAVKTPGYGDVRANNLSDVAALTNAIIVSDVKGIKLKEVQLGMLGRSDKVTITSDTTTIICGNKDNERLNSHLDTLRFQLEDESIAKTQYDRDRIKSRIAKLTNGAVTIEIAATSEVDMNEKRDRYDDSLHATLAALEDGILPGGGTGYIRAISALDELSNNYSGDKLMGIEIIKKVLETPLKQIIDNSGEEKGIAIVEKVKTMSGNYGYNARTREYCDLLEAGVIDPTKVEITALKNAVSMIGLLLTTECVISEKPIEETCNCHK